MKKQLYYFSFLILFLWSCNSVEQQKTDIVTSENDLDAARNFIRAALDGKYDDGKKLLVNDSTNFQFFAEYEKLHSKLNEEERRQYQNSSINIHAISPINDSLTIIIYSNSYKNNHDTLKLLKTQGQWLVDLKYLFNQDSDTLLNPSKEN